MFYSKNQNLIPKKTKLEVLREKYGNSYDDMKKYENFHKCNKNDFIKKEIEVSICDVCGKRIKEDDKKALHHKDYDNKCFYMTKPKCDDCKKNHPEYFEECKKRLTYLHSKCHASIHGKEYEDDEKGFKEDEEI